VHKTASPLATEWIKLIYVTVFLLFSFCNYFMALELHHCRRHRSACKHGV